MGKYKKSCRKWIIDNKMIDFKTFADNHSSLFSFVKMGNDLFLFIKIKDKNGTKVLEVINKNGIKQDLCIWQIDFEQSFLQSEIKKQLQNLRKDVIVTPID